MIKKENSIIDRDYKNFIRRLPCCITGKAGDNIHPHHTKVIGWGKVINDKSCIPLIWYEHTGNISHITKSKLEKKTGLTIKQLVTFYNDLYEQYKSGSYDPEIDSINAFYELRMKLNKLKSKL